MKLPGWVGIWARTHPVKATSLVAAGGLALFFDRNPQLLVALAGVSLFTDRPSFGLVVALLVVCIALFLLVERVRRVERQAVALRTCIGRLILLIPEEARDEAAEIMRDTDRALTGVADLGERDYFSNDQRARRWHDHRDDA